MFQVYHPHISRGLLKEKGLKVLGLKKSDKFIQEIFANLLAGLA